MAAVTICSYFGVQEDTVSIVSSSICHEEMRPDAMILVFWILSFKPTFSVSSFTFIKRLISPSLLSAISVVSFAYLRLLIFLLAISIPVYASSSPAFLMLYSVYKLNKQGDNIQPWCTPATRSTKSTCQPSSHQTVSTPYSEPWGNLGWDNREYWLQIAEVHIKEMISVSPDSCFFPYKKKKSAKFFNLRCLVFFY